MRKAWVLLCAVLGVWTSGAPASAHGIWGHIHVTGWAVENMPEGELRSIFDEREVFEAALFGAAFPDSGYWPQGGELSSIGREYAEHSHWEPFVEAYIQWMIANDPPPFDTLESRMRVAFLMGVAAHGLQDELFDSLYLYEIEIEDTSGQDDADPATDGFLAMDGLLRFQPETYLPMDILLELYADVDERITEGIIRECVNIMRTFYVRPGGYRVAEGQARARIDRLPWTRETYLDPNIPGTLRAEIWPTMHYMEAIWERLHGRWSDEALVIHTWPPSQGRLRDREPGTPRSWVTFVVGRGIENANATVTWRREDGSLLQFARRGTRWGGDRGPSRLLRFQPLEALASGEWTLVTLEPGARLIDGASLAYAHSLEVQAPCDDPNDPLCPAIEPRAPAAMDSPIDFGGSDDPRVEDEPSPEQDDDVRGDDVHDDDPREEDTSPGPEEEVVPGDDVIAPPPTAPPSSENKDEGCGGCQAAGGEAPWSLSLALLLLMALAQRRAPWRARAAARSGLG